MKLFNITAQIYDKNDSSKQTVLMNDIIQATNQEAAKHLFITNLISRKEVLINILSLEEIDAINQV